MDNVSHAKRRQAWLSPRASSASIYLKALMTVVSRKSDDSKKLWALKRQTSMGVVFLFGEVQRRC
eukprot:1159493-Pelagomonas_calceolata.AAC.3